jgi:hypothetical protein
MVSDLTGHPELSLLLSLSICCSLSLAPLQTLPHHLTSFCLIGNMLIPTLPLSWTSAINFFFLFKLHLRNFDCDQRNRTYDSSPHQRETKLRASLFWTVSPTKSRKEGNSKGLQQPPSLHTHTQRWDRTRFEPTCTQPPSLHSVLGRLPGLDLHPPRKLSV